MSEKEEPRDPVWGMLKTLIGVILFPIYWFVVLLEGERPAASEES